MIDVSNIVIEDGSPPQQARGRGAAKIYEELFGLIDRLKPGQHFLLPLPDLKAKRKMASTVTNKARVTNRWPFRVTTRYTEGGIRIYALPKEATVEAV